MRYWALSSLGLICLAVGMGAAPPAAAQRYNQFIAFGDSTTDTGWFANAKLAPSISTNPFDIAVANSVAAGGNAHFTGPGPGNAQILAGYLGLTANPANTPGGTNYAIGGAFDNGGPGLASAYTNFMLLANGLPLNPAIPGTVGQIDNYLASVHGQANPNALYLISSGGNDGLAFALIPPADRVPYFESDTLALATSVAHLQSAGARYIIVANEYGATPAGKALEDVIWSDLSALGVKFIPADTQAVIAAVGANPGKFGITAALNSFACVPPAGYPLTYAYGPTCAPTTLPNPNYGYLVSSDALQTHLLMDGAHLTAAGQLIIADYYDSLLSAPSQVSFLAENAVKVRTRFVNAAQTQIEASLDQRGAAGVNAWVTGDISHLAMNNYEHLPDDPGTPAMLAAGADFRLSPQIIVGGIISTATQRSSFSTMGNFTADEIAGSVYAGYRGDPWWGNAILTYGHLDYAVNRDVPIGITVQSNKGTTSGGDWSLAAEGGYTFRQGWINLGPVVGLTMQRVNVGDFTETGSFTSLAFGDQDRNSLISALGFRATFDWGAWHPFAQVAWNHEFADTNRNVTAYLTTVTAPGYSLPAVILGKDWGTGSVGTSWKMGSNVTALGAFTAEFGQRDATSYGVQIGLNVAF
jgi:outer membrane lipase/esterase